MECEPEGRRTRPARQAPEGSAGFRGGRSDKTPEYRSGLRVRTFEPSARFGLSRSGDPGARISPEGTTQLDLAERSQDAEGVGDGELLAARKLKKGRGFDLSDLKDQLEQMMNMGGMASMLEKLPLPGGVDPSVLKDPVHEQQFRRQIAIINSMTPGEREFPKTINGSRKKRIAKGAGLEIQDVNRLLKQHQQMSRMMKKMSKGGMKRMMRGMPGRGLPPGFG